MKARMVVGILCLGSVLLPMALHAQGRGGEGKTTKGAGNVKALYNPVPFQNFVVSPSAPVRFLLSESGKQFLRQSGNPKHLELLRALGEETSGVTPQPLPPGRTGGGPLPSDPGNAVQPCLPASGTAFNLEPSTSFLPQNEESVDFMLGRVTAGVDLVVGGANDYRRLGGSVTGYYVNRGTACTPTFEGGLPAVADPLQAGDTLEGGGDPVIAADPARDAFFAADLRFDSSTTGIGVLRTTGANLLDTVNCPAGTHTAAQALTCWPTKRVLNPLPFSGVAYFMDKPHLAVDERATGTGAGDVYVVATEFDFFEFFSRIKLHVCNNALTACSSGILISNDDTATQFSHVAVRPDGVATITYINVDSITGAFQIKYVRCNPGGAPFSPSCLPPVLVHNETQPLAFGGFLGAQDFRIATYPKHAHRVDANGTETYIVWDRCKIAPLFGGNVCPDADVVMKATNTGLAVTPTFLPAAPAAVNTNSNDQFFPWITTDRSRNILNIVYYDSNADTTFQHRVLVRHNHINPGAVVPDPITDAHTITTLLNDPSSDPFLGGFFFGDYIGVAARGTGADTFSRAYVHFTYNDIQKDCDPGAGVINCPQQDNKMGRLDY